MPARITWIAPDGRVLADSREDAARMENHCFRREVASALAGRRGSVLRLSVSVRRRSLYVAIPSTAAPGWVTRVAMPIDQFTHHVRAETRVLIIGTVVTTLLANGLSAVVAGRLTRPLHAMQQSLKRLEHGEFGVRLEPGGDTRWGSWRAA